MAFAIFCSINYIASYFMWTYKQPEHYVAVLTLRILAGVLCVGLLIKDNWPANLRKYFQVYLPFTLIYCLPFVTTSMFFTMNTDVEWLINLTLAIMLLTRLVDWLSFVLTSLIGVMLGYLSYREVRGMSHISGDFETTYLIIYICVFASLIGIIFARRREIDADERIEVMQFMAGNDGP